MKFEVAVTANSPKQAAEYALEDLNETLNDDLVAEVSSEHGSCVVNVD